jgi:hypothetical protein
MRNPAQRFNARQPRPAVFATQHAGRFEGTHVVRQPAPSASRMITAPERTRTAPENRGRRVMQAPRDRPRPMQPAPREQRAPESQRAYTRDNRAQRAQGAAAPRARQPAPARTERGGKGNHDKRDDGGHG